MKKGVIMAGGFGTRLRPLTSNLPKPMVPMVNVPMMEHIVNLLKEHDITDIVSVLYYQPEKITGHFGTGGDFGISMNYVQAAADYGTAGSIRNSREYLDERFIIISGDVLTDFDISEAIRFHEEKQALATIVLTKAQNPLQFGIVMTNEEGRITRFLEKPTWGEVFSDTINTGIYILEPEVLDLIPYRKEFDFSKDLYPLMLERKLPLYGHIARGYWKDIGNLNQYQDAHRDILHNRVKIRLAGTAHNEVYLEEGARVHESARLSGKVIVGKNSSIGPNAEVSNTVLGADVSIGPAAKLSGCVLWDRVHIGEAAELSDDVICNDTVIGGHATVQENVFIADSCSIGDYAELHSNIKLWPNKEVESRAIVSRSMVQEERWLRELFTHARVSGVSNVEMNPEFGAKFGAALGNACGAGTRVIVSRDANKASRMLKRAITTGMISVGVNVTDLQDLPLPLTRQGLLTGKEVAGIHVRRSPHLPNHLDIIVLNADGRDIDTSGSKKIERLFLGEDIRRVAPEDVGSILYPERTFETYQNRYAGALDVQAIRDRLFNVVIDYSYGMAATVFPRLLGEMHCNTIGLNAYLDPSRSTRNETELQIAQENMSRVITSLKYECGFMIDPSAEKIAVVDQNGTWYSSARLVSIIARLFLETHRRREPYKIAVPVSASREIDIIAADYNVDVVRIKNSHSAMMEATLDKDILFVGGTRAGFIFTDFFFASDAMFTIGKVLEMLAASGKSLPKINESIPLRHQARHIVPCPWEKKGAIMRRSMEYSEGKERQLIDGVKIFDDEYSVLLLPDPEKACFHVIAEADAKADAEAFAAEVAGLVERWRDEK